MNLPPLGLLWKFGGWWGWTVIGLTLGGIGAGPWSFPLSCALLGAALATVWAFRSPRRPSPPADALVAPADGVVDDVEGVEDSPFLPGRVVRIGIFLSLADVHAIRAPVSGRVERVVAVPGGHGSAAARDSGGRNQRNETWLLDADGHRVCMRQIAGRVARRAVFGPRAGDEVRAGAVIGMIRFGSRVELFLPRSAYRVRVKPGTRVRAGEEILGVRDGSCAPCARVRQRGVEAISRQRRDSRAPGPRPGQPRTHP
jgi:phosphatidylserine decarboxylase